MVENESDVSLARETEANNVFDPYLSTQAAPDSAMKLKNLTLSPIREK